MNADEIESFLAAEFPQALKLGASIRSIEHDALVLALPADERHLRPGGTVSGPTLMTLADTAMYLMILSRIGPVRLAVTTHLGMDFMRRPQPGTLLATAELLKLGRRLAVGRVTIRHESAPDAIAHATVTYALPPPGVD